jgi:hypothetical protein
MKNSLLVLVLIPLVFSCNREFSSGSRRGFQGNTHIVEAKKKMIENESSSPHRSIQSEQLQGSSFVNEAQPGNELASTSKLNQEIVQIENQLNSRNKKEENKECDEIILRSGETIKASILEIGESEIKYKICPENSGRPTYSISKSKVLLIAYENGEKEIFNEPVKQMEQRNSYGTQENIYSGFKRMDGIGIASLIIGILSPFLLFFPSIFTILFSLFFSLIAIILGSVSLSKISKSNNQIGGLGFAIAGIALGFLCLIFFMVIFIRLL